MSVVVGYVPDATGLLAVRQGALEARWRATDVIIVNVVDAAGFTRPTAADDKNLDAIAAELTADGVRFEVRHVEGTDDGRASQVLLDVAADTNADLIVVGLKRTSPVVKAVLGSTAQRVLMGAHCPVLSVRAIDD